MPITIRLKRNGPYLIAADQANDVTIFDPDGNVLVPEAGKPIKLCRCGDSATKPFCDGTHRVTCADKPLDPPPSPQGAPPA